MTVVKSYATVYAGSMPGTMPRPKRTEPAKPDDQVPISIRFPGPIYNAVSELSERERRSFSAQVLHMLEKQIEVTRRSDV